MKTTRSWISRGTGLEITVSDDLARKAFTEFKPRRCRTPSSGHPVGPLFEQAKWFGKTMKSATDGQAIHDHFKKIDDNAVMGIMNGKAGVVNGRHGYFYLERV
jgi:Domain of unknown function (DUF4334)